MDEEKLEKIEEARITELVATEGWQAVKSRALQYVETLESVKTLPSGTNAEVGEEAKVRARAIGLFLTWLNDIESVAEAKFQDEQSEYSESYIRTY